MTLGDWLALLLLPLSWVLRRRLGLGGPVSKPWDKDGAEHWLYQRGDLDSCSCHSCR